MSHWAQVNANNKVIQVTVGSNEFPDEGYQWLIDNLGGTWIKTSYNSKIRKNYAGIGYTYDEQRDAFIPPKPFASWILDELTCLWNAPKPYPNDGKFYIWNETKKNWDEVTE